MAVEETVREVPGFPGYLVSDLGNVYSTRGGARTPLKLMVADGRVVVSLFRDGEGTKARVHNLVLAAFVGPRPPGMVACHFPDPDTRNNRLSNLRWDTPRANEADKIFHGTTNRGARNGAAKMTEAQAREALRRRGEGETHRAIATSLGVSTAAVQMLCNGATWKHLAREEG